MLFITTNLFVAALWAKGAEIQHLNNYILAI